MTATVADKFIGSFDLSMIQSMDEFDKRYANSYLLVRTPKKIEDIFYYEGFTGRNCVFRNDVYGEIRLNPHTESIITPFFPKVGLFNYDKLNSAVFTCKVPVRQNRRSMSDKNVKLEDPIQSVFRMRRNLLQFDFPIIRAALFPVFPDTIAKAIHEVMKNDKVSVAFSSDYMVSLGHTEHDVILWNKAVPVGVIKGNAVQIDEHYAQEFKDYIRDHNEPYFVQELH